MKTVYLKCHHGKELRTHCELCKKEQDEMKKRIHNHFTEKKKDERIPILKGCGVPDGGECFCTGACKEVIGYYQ